MMKISDEFAASLEASKEKIGELLLKHSALTRLQLEEALDMQRNEGGLIGDILIKKNFINTNELRNIFQQFCQRILFSNQLYYQIYHVRYR